MDGGRTEHAADSANQRGNQKLSGPIFYRIAPFFFYRCLQKTLCGISHRFQWLFPCMSQVAHALLTRPPLGSAPKRFPSLDLHVLSTPPAFILSQDQTLIFLVRPVRTLLSDFFSFLLSFFSSSFLMNWLGFGFFTIIQFSRINCAVFMSARSILSLLF